MPLAIKILKSTGRLEDVPVSAGSLQELASIEPEGIYTVARTFARDKAVLLDAHLDRLEDSARLEDIPLILDRAQLRKALSRLIDECGFEESRFRITIPRHQRDTIWLAVEPLPLLPSTLKHSGVRAATCEVNRPNPHAKSNAWVALRNEASKGIPADIYEAIIIRSDRLMEGFSSNFYAVRAGVLYTAEHGILHGIARQVVLNTAPGIVPLQFEPISVHELPGIDEAFLSSSSRGVLPIVQIDEVMIGDGLPGPYTSMIGAAYDHWVQDHLLPIAPP